MVAFVAESRASGALGADPNPAKPAGATVGHLLTGMVYNAAGGAITVPADTNPWQTAESSIAGLRLFWKTLNADDTPLTNFLFTVTAGNTAVNLVAFSGAHPTNPFDGINVVQTTTGGNIVIPQITPSVATYLWSMVQKMVSNAGQTFTPLNGQAEKYDGATPNGFGTAGGDETVTAGVPTGSRTWDPSNATSGAVAGYLFALRNASTVHNVTADLVGDGVLSRSLLVGVPRDIVGDGAITRMLAAAAARDLVGDGSMSLEKAISMAEDLSGIGVIDEVHTKALNQSADLVGDGVVTRQVGVATTRDITGDGEITYIKATVAAKTFDLVGVGTITETEGKNYFRSFNLVGIGEMVDNSICLPISALPQCAPDWSPNDGLKSISGDVFFHEPPNEGDPVVGATVTLIRDDDGFIAGTTTTDASGHYEFPRDTNDPHTYHVEVRYSDGGVDQQGLSEGGCVPV